MKKIMLALDAEKPDQQSIAFGIYIARLTGSGLTGIFLENMPEPPETGVKFAYGGVYVESINPSGDPETIFKEKTTAENIRSFKEACEAQELTYEIHRDQGIPQEELISESRYADVIITSPRLFAESALQMPARLVKSLLNNAECAVIIAPHHTNPINNIFFAFDGSTSALFAIKQFTYLFPELSGATLTVLQADENALFHEDQKEKLYRYLKPHYSHIAFKDLRGKAKDELFDYCLRETNAFLVMGAYGRNWLSSFFKPSTANLVIQLNSLPVFIAH